MTKWAEQNVVLSLGEEQPHCEDLYQVCKQWAVFCFRMFGYEKCSWVGAAEEFLDFQLADAKDEIDRTRQALMDTD